jgi:UDPglucose 6-dehydrogenase
VGGGYVGLVTAAGFASLGHEVTCVEVDPARAGALEKDVLPIHEEGLEELWREVRGHTLSLARRGEEAYRRADIVMICVGTPSLPDGSIDLKYVVQAAQEVGAAIAGRRPRPVVVVKSTVVPGTTEAIILPALEGESGGKAGRDFGLAVCPEFLAEGSALRDFLKPDRVVVGGIDDPSREAVAAIHEPLGAPIVRTDLRTAEMVKYASNAFLAARVSLANEIGNICKSLGIDAYEVMEAVGMDHRIGPHFLRSGLGFGGSCFPKDLRALATAARSLGIKPAMVEAILAVNEGQPQRMLEVARRKLGGLRGKRIAVLGLAFKGGTDDVRESRAIPLMEALKGEGAHVVAYDPKAMEGMKALVGGVEYASSAAEALREAEACLVAADWPEFSRLGEEFGGMKRRLIIDGRRIIEPTAEGIEYEGLCW